MSTFRSYAIQCACRHTFRADLAVAVNAVRMPELRKAIIDGRLHRVTCPACGGKFTAEKRFLYTDLARKTVIHVRPPGESFGWREAGAEVDEGLAGMDLHGAARGKLHRRVVFGIGELRDKLIAQDAGLDDRHVELAKVLAVHEHPVLLRRSRLRLFLDAVHGDRLTFHAGYDHAQQAFKIDVPRHVVERLAENGTGRKWVAGAHGESIFSPASDHWVSLRRWAPSNAALGTLHAAAETAARGGAVDLDADAFKLMIEHLPRGAELPGAAKLDLRTLEKYAGAKARPDIQAALFKVRFGVAIDDEWGVDRQSGDIDTIWDLLKDLPETNVEGNTHLHEILLHAGDAETAGSYDPSSHDVEVVIDPFVDPEAFRSVMRHEVGHAVHDKLDKEQNLLVTSRLKERFGWQSFPGTATGAREWIALMDGWDGLEGSDRDAVVAILLKGLGPGKVFAPPPPPHPPASHPWWRKNLGPRLALSRSVAHWFEHSDKWHRQGDYAFFVNYWYRQFMAVHVAVLDFVKDKMPSAYAAMSGNEFFAEMYALYYGLTQRKNIAEPDRAWFDKHVGAPGPRAAAAAPAGARRARRSPVKAAGRAR